MPDVRNWQYLDFHEPSGLTAQAEDVRSGGLIGDVS